MKVCYKCGVNKPLFEFNTHSRAKDGKHSYCKPCSTETKRFWRKANREKVNRYEKENSEAKASSHLKRKYGITIDEKLNMWGRQKGCCAICGSLIENFRNGHVDHDHNTGKVRGMLCVRCNMGLGYFKDDISKLQAAVNYLQKGKE